MDDQFESLLVDLRAQPRSSNIAMRRRLLDDLADIYPVPADITVERVMADMIPAEWTRSPTCVEDGVLLFLHGGAYVAGSTSSHRHLVAEAGRQSRLPTFTPDYRRGPEHPFPAAIEDGMATYRFLLSQGFHPGRIAIAGDSAGGGLTLAVLIALRNADVPLPACAWCISPWLDLTSSASSMVRNAERDPLIRREYLLENAALYLAGADPSSPLASPGEADLTGLPPILLQVGSAEVMLDEALRFAARAGTADVAITLEVWPRMIHAWPLFYHRLAAGREALTRAGSYIQSYIRRR